ncbi:MAG: hypothetical protein NC357_09220, partial [Bacteroides sp.]|nr:hypothetical protein [Bacteroides sp.]
MKAKSTIILFLCMLSQMASANPNIITRERWAAWRMVWSMYREYTLDDGHQGFRTDQYFFGKDTTIGNDEYWEVFWRKNSDERNEVSAGYALREDSVRVYVYDYAGQREHVLFDFSLQVNDVLAMDWVEETDTRRNPVFRALAVGDTVISNMYGGRKGFHYLKVYDTVHQVTDMWMNEVGSVSHGIAWRKDFGRSLDTLETILCTNAGSDYKNPDYTSCYISEAKPEYVSCTGTLILALTPSFGFPPIDCCVEAIAIKVGNLTPILSYNSTWAFDGAPLQVEGVDYAEGDSVEVKGYVSSSYDIGGRLYSEMQLECIRKVGAAPTEKHPKAELILSPNPAGETI